MSIAVVRRKGTTAEHAAFTGLEGEITIDTTKKTVVVHDGITVGGIPLAKSSESLLKAEYDTDNDGKVDAAEVADNAIAVDGIVVDLADIEDGFILYYDAASGKVLSKQDSGGGGGLSDSGFGIVDVSGGHISVTFSDSGITPA